jgi:hypothetical protein
VPRNQPKLKLEINKMAKTHGWIYQITQSDFEDQFIATAYRRTTLESAMADCQQGTVFDLGDPNTTLPDEVEDITGLIQNEPSRMFVHVTEDDYGDPDCFYFGFEPLSRV